MATINSLPLDVWSVLSQFVGFQDYSRARQVCKLWRSRLDPYFKDGSDRFQAFKAITNFSAFTIKKSSKWILTSDSTGPGWATFKIAFVYHDIIGIVQNYDRYKNLRLLSFTKPVPDIVDCLYLCHISNICFLFSLEQFRKISRNAGKSPITVIDLQNPQDFRTYWVPLRFSGSVSAVDVGAVALSVDRIALAANGEVFSCHLTNPPTSKRIGKYSKTYTVLDDGTKFPDVPLIKKKGKLLVLQCFELKKDRSSSGKNSKVPREKIIDLGSRYTTENPWETHCTQESPLCFQQEEAGEKTLKLTFYSEQKSVEIVHIPSENVRRFQLKSPPSKLTYCDASQIFHRLIQALFFFQRSLVDCRFINGKLTLLFEANNGFMQCIKCIQLYTQTS